MLQAGPGWVHYEFNSVKFLDQVKVDQLAGWATQGFTIKVKKPKSTSWTPIKTYTTNENSQTYNLPNGGDAVKGVGIYMTGKAPRDSWSRLLQIYATGRNAVRPPPTRGGATTGTCTCQMNCDNDIDEVYVDGVNKGNTVTNWNQRANWGTRKTIQFACGEKTILAVKAVDGNGNSGGCRRAHMHCQECKCKAQDHMQRFPIM